MPRRLNRNARTLRALCCARYWHHIIDTATDDLLKCLSDCSYNILAGNTQVNRRQHYILSRHRQLLRSIRPRRKPKQVRTELLTYGTPNFIRALVTPALLTA